MLHIQIDCIFSHCRCCSFDELSWSTSTFATVGFNKGDGVSSYSLPGSKTAAGLGLTCSNALSTTGCYTFRVDGDFISDATPSNSQTPSMSRTQSLSQVPTSSGTSTQVATPSASPTQSRTVSMTPTPSASLTSLLLFDGTEERSAALPAPGTALTILSSTSFYAIAFTMSEIDTSCGPGLYSLSFALLALSQVCVCVDCCSRFIVADLFDFDFDSLFFPITGVCCSIRDCYAALFGQRHNRSSSQPRVFWWSNRSQHSSRSILCRRVVFIIPGHFKLRRRPLHAGAVFAVSRQLAFRQHCCR
jgi:hypothetical protein